MKALIRRKGETVTEDMEIPGIEWDTGYPLTASGWASGPYTLVSDYVPEVEDDLDFINGLHEQLVEDTEPEDTETVTINGKEYTVEEAREILGVKL